MCHDTDKGHSFYSYDSCCLLVLDPDGLCCITHDTLGVKLKGLKGTTDRFPLLEQKVANRLSQPDQHKTLRPSERQREI